MPCYIQNLTFRDYRLLEGTHFEQQSVRGETISLPRLNTNRTIINSMIRTIKVSLDTTALILLNLQYTQLWTEIIYPIHFDIIFK